jgi:hypothetical protein
MVVYDIGTCIAVLAVAYLILYYAFRWIKGLFASPSSSPLPPDTSGAKRP